MNIYDYSVNRCNPSRNASIGFLYGFLTILHVYENARKGNCIVKGQYLHQGLNRCLKIKQRAQVELAYGHHGV